MNLTLDERTKIFEKVCRLVETKHFNPAMNGADWNALVRSRRDQIIACDDPEVFEKEVNRLVAELKTSHTGFQIHYPRASPIAPLQSLGDRAQHALPNFGRESNGVIRILVRELPPRMSLYPRPEPARDDHQLVVVGEQLPFVVWGTTRKDPIWVQFRARHPGASHLLGFAGQS